MEEHFWELAIGLAVTFVSFATGVPYKIYSFLKNKYISGRAKKHISAGLFDDESLSAALKYYVRPFYSSLDPSVTSEPHQSLINARADLFDMMDRFFSEGGVRHLLIFADSGMGKTSFVLNYFSKKYSAMKKRRMERCAVPLSSAHADEFITDLSISDRRDVILLLDALDEDSQAIGRAEERLQELIGISEGYKAVVVTCRTQFFKSDSRIPIATGLMRPGVVKAGLSKEYEFQKVYLSPFDERQVRKYLRKRYPSLLGWRGRARAMAVINRVPLLSVRPMLLAHIPELLASNCPVDQSVDVYQVMVDAWADRERAWIPKDKLIEFSKCLAVGMYVGRDLNGGEIMTPEQVESEASKYSATDLLKHFSSRSLLNRRSDGVLKFAHRSIMEYFVSHVLVSGEGAASMEVTDQMAKFVMQLCRCSDYRSEEIVTSKKVRVDLCGSTKRLGREVNYELYFPVSEVIAPSGMVILPVRSDGETKEIRFSDYLEQVSISRGGAFAINEVRIRCFGIKNGDVEIYVSVWMEAGGVAHFEKLYARDVALRSVVLGQRYSSCEFDIVGRPNKSRRIENLEWRLEVKSDIGGVSPMADSLSVLHANSSVGFKFDPSNDVVTLSILRGSAASPDFGFYGVVLDGFLNYSRSRDSFTIRGVDSKGLI